MATDQAFAVPGWMDWLGGRVAAWPRFWIGLGRFESALFRDRYENMGHGGPIWVCGMARSGSTVLLESLARHPSTATHRYRDFPLVHAPLMWNQFLDRAMKPAPPVERAHGDGILVTPDSPEAVEEVLWMSFFEQLHQRGESDRLDAGFSAPAFEHFYRDHMFKLLWRRGGSRYLAKNNYATTRMEYLLRQFPDARFIVPVREPASHIASLLRQHRRFCEWHAADARALRYMQRLGHFEFGLDRRTVDCGVAGEADAIRAAWARGADLEGYALAWDSLYRFVADRLDSQPALKAATLLVRHEALCADPATAIHAVLSHCGLNGVELDRVIPPPSPAARPSGFSETETALIRQLTGATAARYGYV